jgi:UDP:flavonoid glycosyltransferase YjiC (YdhE family)
LGVGRVMDAITSTPEQIRDAVHRVRADASITAKTAALRDELLALPSPEALIPHVIGLAERKH